MYELYPYFTNDGSVGLFSPEADDIYHSTYGALTEAYEKFIMPSEFQNYFENNSEIKILDICYGIGYNTKSFLNYFFENILEKNKKNKNDKMYCNDKIHTDNNFERNIRNKFHDNTCYNEEIDADNIISYFSTYNLHGNKKFKIFIQAIDTDKNLSYLSPFFITGKKNRNSNKLSFKQEKIEKILSKKLVSNYKIKKEVNIILLKKIIEEHNSIFKDEEFLEILKNKKYKQYFDKYMLNLFKFYQNEGYNKTYLRRLIAFLHNIYYEYLSKSYKKAANCLLMNEIDFNLKIEDARKAIIEDNNTYNYIFLDAFTPAKCPCLWTTDFFNELFKHLDNNGMILTYSNSANIRNAFLQSGFFVGKIFNKKENKYTGTIAVKNKLLIKHELTEYDLGLLKTKAGIIYRDESLTLDNESIIEAHKNEAANSTLISSSKYIKAYNRNNSL